MRRVNCCDLLQYRWEERSVHGDPPTNAHARRGLDCFVDGRRLIVFGNFASSKAGCCLNAAVCMHIYMAKPHKTVTMCVSDPSLLPIEGN